MNEVTGREGFSKSGSAQAFREGVFRLRDRHQGKSQPEPFTPEFPGEARNRFPGASHRDAIHRGAGVFKHRLRSRSGRAGLAGDRS